MSALIAAAWVYGSCSMGYSKWSYANSNGSSCICSIESNVWLNNKATLTVASYIFY